jgi:hypothetical protein
MERATGRSDTIERIRYLNADSFADALSRAVGIVDESKAVSIELVRNVYNTQRYALKVIELVERPKARKLDEREGLNVQLGYLVRARFELRARLDTITKRIDEIKRQLDVS